MTAADIRFDPDEHRYTTPAGVVVPSVTQVLKATGVSVDFEALPGRDAIARKRDIGVAVHSDIHAADDGDLDWSTVHDEVKPYVHAWLMFREAKRLTPMARERRVYDPIRNVAGTFDGVFSEAGQDSLVLIDVKCGDPKAAAAQYQTAGYVMAYAIEVPESMGYRRWSVQLMPERPVPFVVTPYNDWQDFNVWQSIVTTFWASAQRRSLAA